MTGRFACSVLRSTNLVCGRGPSPASTSRTTPSTMDRPRSTSPPKSACPGVSTMLMVSPPWPTAVFLARIVMPFSRSRSPESSTRSATRSLARNAPDCQSIASTSVVLPWSTCATIATLRRSSRADRGRAGIRKPYRISVWMVRPWPPGHVQGRQAILASTGNGLLSGSSRGLNAFRGVLIPYAGQPRLAYAGQLRSSRGGPVPRTAPPVPPDMAGDPAWRARHGGCRGRVRANRARGDGEQPACPQGHGRTAGPQSFAQPKPEPFPAPAPPPPPAQAGRRPGRAGHPGRADPRAVAVPGTADHAPGTTAQPRAEPGAHHLQPQPRRGRLMPVTSPAVPGQRACRALGTYASVATTDPAALEQAYALLTAELTAVDAACSRFRRDAELR